MPTSVNNNQGQVQGNQNGSGNGSIGSQISAGSAALVYQMINEIMDLQTQIMKYDQVQKVNMIQAQNQAANSQAEATENSGLTQAIMYGVMGAASIGGVVVGQVAQYKTLNTPAGQKAELDFNTANEKLNAFKEPQAALLEANKPVAPNRGNLPPAVDEPTQDQIDARVRELRDVKDFKDLKNNKTDVAALKKMQSDAPANAANKAAFEAKNVQLNSEIEGPRMEYNSAVTARATLHTTATNNKQVVDTIVNGLSSAAQAGGNGVKAGFDATNSMAQTAGQMAGSSTGDMGQAMGKALEAELAQVQMWKSMVESASRV